MSEADIDRIIEMAWEDRTPFEAIQAQFGLSESEVVRLMRLYLKASGFRRWRERVHGRMTKHQYLRYGDIQRFKCTRQRDISRNRISKR